MATFYVFTYGINFYKEDKAKENEHGELIDRKNKVAKLFTSKEDAISFINGCISEAIGNMNDFVDDFGKISELRDIKIEPYAKFNGFECSNFFINEDDMDDESERAFMDVCYGSIKVIEEHWIKVERFSVYVSDKTDTN